MPEAIENVKRRDVCTCYLCASDGDIIYQNVKDRLYNVPGLWNLRRCQSVKCGLVWIDPMPYESEIWKLYVDYFTHHESNTDANNSEVAMPDVSIRFLNSRLKRSLFAKYFNYTEFRGTGAIAAVTDILTSFSLFRARMGRKIMWLNGNWRTRLLDYGCGNGRFLGQMKGLGWDVVGFELDKKAAKVASESFGINVYSDQFTSIADKEKGFDVITLSHVIEHLPDPVATLKQCLQLLNPDGKLIIVTPNFDSLGRKYFKEAWRPMETPRHLYLLNKNTLSAIAEKSGMKIENIWTHADSASGIWSRSKVIKRAGHLDGGNPVNLPNYAKRGSKLFSSLERILTRFFPCGEEMVAIIKKQ